MGNRFISRRYPLNIYSRRRQFLYINEEGRRPHAIKAYGLHGGKFQYRSIYERKDARTDRAAKRSVRQQAKRALLASYYTEK